MPWVLEAGAGPTEVPAQPVLWNTGELRYNFMTALQHWACNTDLRYHVLNSPYCRFARVFLFCSNTRLELMPEPTEELEVTLSGTIQSMLH